MSEVQRSIGVSARESLSEASGQQSVSIPSEIESTEELQGDSPIKGVSIVASHGKRMICILRSFLLDYGDLRLEPTENCIEKFYGSIVDGVEKYIDDNDHLEFLPKKKEWYKKIHTPWKFLKSPCYTEDFKKTFPRENLGELNSELSNMKCFPQFTNGSAINIEIKKEGGEVYTLTVSLIPPKDPLEKDEDLENKLVFMAQGSEDKYLNYKYKVPFHKLTFNVQTNCYLITKLRINISEQYNVIIVRHGQGYHNLANFNSLYGVGHAVSMGARTLGTADTHLTDKGIEDAKKGADSISEYFNDLGLDERQLNGKCNYFSSDLYRAKETAVLIAKHFGKTEVVVTQLPIIHEISNCEKADGFTGSSKPDMNFPGDRKNPKDNIYCPNWWNRLMSHYSKSLGRGSQGCGEDGITVKIDYERFYTKVNLYNTLFSSQYGYTGNRTTRGWFGAFKDTSFLFKPYEIIELLLAFTFQVMTDNPDFYVNGGEDNSVIEPLGKQQYPPELLKDFPGFRGGPQSPAYKYMNSMLGRTTGGGNRNTLKKRRKRKTNQRRTNKRRTNKRRTNKRKTNKKRTYKKRRTARQRK